jgi:hypothetical protein
VRVSKPRVDYEVHLYGFGVWGLGLGVRGVHLKAPRLHHLRPCACITLPVTFTPRGITGIVTAVTFTHPSTPPPLPPPNAMWRRQGRPLRQHESNPMGATRQGYVGPKEPWAEYPSCPGAAWLRVRGSPSKHLQVLAFRNKSSPHGSVLDPPRK